MISLVPAESDRLTGVDPAVNAGPRSTPHFLSVVTGDRLARAYTAVHAERRSGRAEPDPGVQGGLRDPVHLHDRQVQEERTLLRQIHRLLPDPVYTEGDEKSLSNHPLHVQETCLYLHPSF